MNRKIMIVDDEEHILKILQRLLLHEPYDCTLFSSPVKALDSMKQINPAVVISDQRMPKMEGTQLLKKTKELLPWSVRVIMTGYADINVVISAINKGHVFRFIKKPWDDDFFKSELKTAIEYFDMTQRLRCLSDETALADIVMQERLQGMLEMAGAVCHEFAQPLQVITGYCDMLVSSPKSRIDIDTAAKYISSISRETGKLGELLSKIMAVKDYKTRPYAGNTRIIDIHN
ncbi:MAG: response regulator [Thermodesulfobacteriota bacterium]|nr:response regulator [Thermodesulfobacteriota bacterium]